MNQPSQRPRPSQQPFWKRILERYKFRGRLLRARVPLVLFRFWSPGASRQAHTGLRPTVAQYPLNLQLQFFWQQSISNESGPRAMIERSIFTHLVTKELKQVWKEPRRIESSATQLSYDAIRPSAKASANADRIAGGRQTEFRSAAAPPVETGPTIAAGAPGRVAAPLHNTLAYVLPDQVAIVPETFRLFTERILKNKLHTVTSKRTIFAASAARIGEFAHRRRTVSAVGASSSPSEGANALQPALVPKPALVPSGRVARAFRSRRAMMDAISAPGQSQFIHPAQAEGSGQSSLQGSRSRLFAQSAWLNLASHPASGPAAQPAAQGQTSLPPPPVVVPASQPQLDIGRLSDEVYRHIQRKIRIERERRGI